MEYLSKLLRKTGWSSIITSAVFALIGIILIASPDATFKMITTILGVALLLMGGWKIITYLTHKGEYSVYSHDLAYGVMTIVVGIIIMAYQQEIGKILGILIGLWIIYSSVTGIILSLQLKKANSKLWIWSLVIAFIMLACGIYTVCNAGAIVIAVGIVILIYSILDIIEGIIFLNNLKKLA